MKKLTMIAAAAVFTLSMCTAAFAGSWQGSYESGWKWQNDDGSYAAGNWYWLDGDNDGIAESYLFDGNGICLTGAGQTPDGYTINDAGAWVQDGAVMKKNLASGEVYAENASAGGTAGTAAAVGAYSTNLADHQGRYEGVWAYDVNTYEAQDIYGWLDINGNTAVMNSYVGGEVVTLVVDPNGTLSEDGTTAVWNATSVTSGGYRLEMGILAGMYSTETDVTLDLISVFVGNGLMYFFAK